MSNSLSNSPVAPAGSDGGGTAMPVTPHQTYGHLDDTADGGYLDDVAADDMSPVAPTDTDSNFSGAGHVSDGVQPGNTGLMPMSGPVQPLGFNPGDNHNDGTN